MPNNKVFRKKSVRVHTGIHTVCMRQIYDGSLFVAARLRLHAFFLNYLVHLFMHLFIYLFICWFLVADAICMTVIGSVDYTQYIFYIYI